MNASVLGACPVISQGNLKGDKLLLRFLLLVGSIPRDLPASLHVWKVMGRISQRSGEWICPELCRTWQVPSFPIFAIGIFVNQSGADGQGPTPMRLCEDFL
jgi:hypothetical protein